MPGATCLVDLTAAKQQQSLIGCLQILAVVFDVQQPVSVAKLANRLRPDDVSQVCMSDASSCQRGLC